MVRRINPVAANREPGARVAQHVKNAVDAAKTKRELTGCQVGLITILIAWFGSQLLYLLGYGPLQWWHWDGRRLITWAAVILIVLTLLRIRFLLRRLLDIKNVVEAVSATEKYELIRLVLQALDDLGFRREGLYLTIFGFNKVVHLSLDVIKHRLKAAAGNLRGLMPDLANWEAAKENLAEARLAFDNAQDEFDETGESATLEAARTTLAAAEARFQAVEQQIRESRPAEPQWALRFENANANTNGELQHISTDLPQGVYWKRCWGWMLVAVILGIFAILQAVSISNWQHYLSY